jgi:hypothetical protein
MSLERALENNAELNGIYFEKAVIECRPIGEIFLPTGRIVVDGSYYSYWGYTDDNELVCLSTDFGVLEEPPNDRNGSQEFWAR